MLAKSLFGKEVIDSQGNKVGSVADLEIDIQTGMTNHVIISSGFFKKYKITLEKIMSIGDKVILKIAKEELIKK